MKLTALQLRQMKAATPIPMLTAYTTPVARSLERAGIPVILVGDTVGMVEMGFDSTRHTTLEHMQYHVGAVRRGAPQTHIIGDLPYNTYLTPEVALNSAKALLAAGADSVKLEGPQLEAIEHLISNGIDVVGHTGLTPQTSRNFKQVGGTDEEARRVFDDAVAIAAAGTFMVVLEHIPASLGEQITTALAVPTMVSAPAALATARCWSSTMRSAWVITGRHSRGNTPIPAGRSTMSRLPSSGRYAKGASSTTY